MILTVVANLLVLPALLALQSRARLADRLGDSIAQGSGPSEPFPILSVASDSAMARIGLATRLHRARRSESWKRVSPVALRSTWRSVPCSASSCGFPTSRPASFVWGLPAFLNNYPPGFPAQAPEPPLWALRSQRAHLNMVETLLAFVGVVWAASLLGGAATAGSVAMWAAVFFWARVGHAIVYTAGIPFLRTPVYLVSWFAVLAIGAQALRLV